jgi:predicted PurR-regulated permease PerM
MPLWFRVGFWIQLSLNIAFIVGISVALLIVGQSVSDRIDRLTERQTEMAGQLADRVAKLEATVAEMQETAKERNTRLLLLDSRVYHVEVALGADEKARILRQQDDQEEP